MVVLEEVRPRLSDTLDVLHEATFWRVSVITPTDALFLLELVLSDWWEFHAPSNDPIETAGHFALRDAHTPRVLHRRAVLVHADADVVLTRARINTVNLHIVRDETARLLIFAKEYLFGLLGDPIEDYATLRESVDVVFTLVLRVFDEVLDGHACLVAVASAGSLREDRPGVKVTTRLQLRH